MSKNNTAGVPVKAAPDNVLREILEDLAYGWDWFSKVTIDFDVPADQPVLTCGWWVDGEVRDAPAKPNRNYTVSTATRVQLTEALQAVADGTVSGDKYQIRAASEYLNDPESADGDAITVDLIVQQALLGGLMFG